MNIKAFVKQHPLMYKGWIVFDRLSKRLFPVRGKNNTISVCGSIIGLKKSIIGDGNVVRIDNSTITNSSIRIRGNGNILVIEEGCHIGDGCSFWLEGNHNKIVVGKRTTMTLRCHLNAQENGTSIQVGEDCMFSNLIAVRTSDSHPIYNDKEERINKPQDVIIGNHVWIAPHSIVMKGAVIGEGSIVGTYSMVNKSVPSNSLVVGMPARVVKENIRWTRENVLV